jgi:hypothetical protein
MQFQCRNLSSILLVNYLSVNTGILKNASSQLFFQKIINYKTIVVLAHFKI